MCIECTQQNECAPSSVERKSSPFFPKWVWGPPGVLKQIPGASVNSLMSSYFYKLWVMWSQSHEVKDNPSYDALEAFVSHLLCNLEIYCRANIRLKYDLYDKVIWHRGAEVFCCCTYAIDHGKKVLETPRLGQVLSHLITVTLPHRNIWRLRQHDALLLATLYEVKFRLGSELRIYLWPI